MARVIKRRKRVIKRRKLDSVSRDISGRKISRRKERVDFISSGCATLNLALSGRIDGGWARARVVNVVGDGSSGKTLLALEAAFWFFNNMIGRKTKVFPKPVKKIHIVFDNIEGVMDFPIEEMYGEDFVKAVEWKRSRTIEAMGSNTKKYLKLSRKKGVAVLYIVDSWDALEARAGLERIEDAMEKEDGAVKGSMNTEKQRYASQYFGHMSGEMEGCDFTLFIVSQVRTKIGVTFGKKTYRAGGKALDFYTHQVAWLREVEKLSKVRKGRKIVFGIRSEAKVERSKVAKPFRDAEFTILYDYGLDDIGACLRFLYGPKEKTIKWDGEKFKTRKQLIKYIEDNDKEDILRQEVQNEWDSVEDHFIAEIRKRKPRY